MHKNDTEINQSIAMLVARIARAWKEAFQQYEQEGFEPFVARHAQLDALVGQVIDVWQDDKFIMQGIARGLNNEAHLLIEMSNGQLFPLLTGDITVRAHETQG